MRCYSFSDYRNCCIRNDMFSAGTNEQFNKVYELMRSGMTLHDLTLATYLCTSGKTLDTIKDILRKELHFA